MKSQNLNINLSIPIPKDKVLIKKIELEELRNVQLKGVWWNIKDLEVRLNRKSEWIKENILYPSRFKKILDVKNGGFVYYPERQGQLWTFHAKKMADFLDRYFSEIFNRNIEG